MADNDFGGAFMRGMTGTADMINANKRTKLYEEAAGREKQLFDQDQHDRTMKRAVAGMYYRTLGPDGLPDLAKLTEAAREAPGMREAMSELTNGGTFESLEQDPEDPDGSVIHIKHADGRADFLTDPKTDNVIRMKKSAVTVHLLGIMGQYAPELADKVITQLQGEVGDDAWARMQAELAPKESQNPAVTGASAPQGLGAAADATAVPASQPAPQPAAQPAAAAPVAPSNPVQPTPPPNAAHTAGSKGMDAVLDADLNATPAGNWPRMSLRDIGHAGGNVFQSLKNQATGAIDGATKAAHNVNGTLTGMAGAVKDGVATAGDFTRGALGMPPAAAEPAATTAPSAKSTPHPAALPSKASAKQTVRSVQAQPPKDGTANSMPARVQANIRGLNPDVMPPQRTKKEVYDFARNVAKLQRLGRLDASSAQTAMSDFYGEATKVITAKDNLVGFNSHNQIVWTKKLPQSDAEAIAADLGYKRLGLELQKVQALRGVAAGVSDAKARKRAADVAGSIADEYAGTGEKHDKKMHQWITEGLTSLIGRRHWDPDDPNIRTVVGRMVGQVRAALPGNGLNPLDNKNWSDFPMANVYAASPFAGENEPITAGFDNLNNQRINLDTKGMGAADLNAAFSSMAQQAASERGTDPDSELARVRAAFEQDPDSIMEYLGGMQ